MGLGYIGLPTASFLATKGFMVHGVDVKPEIVEALKRGDCTIDEPSLDVLVRSATASGRMTVSMEPTEADIFILCVPTPFKESHKPDLRYVHAALESIAPHVREKNLIILESTVPVGATRDLAARLAVLRPDLHIAGACDREGEKVGVAHCPERVLPGHILHELVVNDRIVGGVDEESTRMGVEFYKSFVRGSVQGTDADTAEMVKLAENSFRDVNIAYANELSLICDQLGLDVWRVIRLANRHPRVNILRAGPGVGGHCIAVDPWFLADSAPDKAKLIRAAREVNDAKPQNVTARIANAAQDLPQPVIACFGLAFKPDVDDLRQSPALQITAALAKIRNATILACEPHLRALPPVLAKSGNVRLATLEECLTSADIIAILVGHSAFSQLDAKALSEKIVFDVCGLLKQ